MRITIVLLLALAACKPPTSPTTSNDIGAGATVTLPANLAATATPSTPAIDLAGYVGKYPDDKLAGVAFKDVPAVKAAVAAVVPDTAIAATVIGFEGPNTPIASKDGRLLAHGCETHNCGAHNWTISITPDGRSADVCYKADDAGRPRWFGANPPVSDDDSCPSGDN